MLSHTQCALVCLGLVATACTEPRVRILGIDREAKANLLMAACAAHDVASAHKEYAGNGNRGQWVVFVTAADAPRAFALAADLNLRDDAKSVLELAGGPLPSRELQRAQLVETARSTLERSIEELPGVISAGVFVATDGQAVDTRPRSPAPLVTSPTVTVVYARSKKEPGVHDGTPLLPSPEPGRDDDPEWPVASAALRAMTSAQFDVPQERVAVIYVPRCVAAPAEPAHAAGVEVLRAPAPPPPRTLPPRRLPNATNTVLRQTLPCAIAGLVVVAAALALLWQRQRRRSAAAAAPRRRSAKAA